MFSLLGKRPGDRPDHAGEVVQQLEPFSTSTSAALVHSKTPSPAAKPATAMRPAESSEPVVSTDTIALIERAAAPASIGNRVAVSLLLLITAVGLGLGYASTLFIGSDTASEASR